MTNTGYYIHISPTTMNPCNITDEAYAEATQTWLCTGCVHPKPNVERVDVRIKNRLLQGPLNFVFGCGLAVARMSFLARFREERVKQNLSLGEVFGPNGSRMEDWVTFRGKHGLIVRGTKHAGNRVCSECGRNIYFAMRPHYLYPQPPASVEMFESSLCGLIVPEAIAAEVGIGRKIKHVLVERLRVSGEPKDGLPALPF